LLCAINRKRSHEFGKQVIGCTSEHNFFLVQDQAITIIVEFCQANKLTESLEIKNVCNLLLQILEMALQLELCVLQICAIRPVLGRVEDFSKEAKSLFSGNITLHPSVAPV
jgi:hypothetical protein